MLNTCIKLRGTDDYVITVNDVMADILSTVTEDEVKPVGVVW